MTPQTTNLPPEPRSATRDGLGLRHPVAAPAANGPATAILGAVIACRMESRRLPGKALADLDGLPLLHHVITRCRHAACLAGRIIVATTHRPADDAIAAFCARQGIAVARGPSDNVALRLLNAARDHGLDAFFRINGDSPFLEPALLDQAASLFHLGGCDLVTNLCPRSYPYGVSVELIRTAAYAQAYATFSQPGDFEHVTPPLYRPEAPLSRRNLQYPGPDLSRIRLTVDTPADLDVVRRFLAHARIHGLPTHYESAASFIRDHEAN